MVVVDRPCLLALLACVAATGCARRSATPDADPPLEEVGVCATGHAPTDEPRVTYECANIERPPDTGGVLYNKVVIFELGFGCGYQVLDVRRVTVAYGSGRNHLTTPEPGRWLMRVVDDDGAVIESFDEWHPAMAFLEPPDGCGLIAAESVDIGENITFLERVPRYFEVEDIAGSLLCSDQVYRAEGERLLNLDLQPCLQRFCDEVAAAGDPMCAPTP